MSVLKEVWTGLRMVLGVVSGGKLAGWDSPEQEAQVHGMWTEAARACGVENLVGKRATFMGPRGLEGARVPFTVSIAPVGAAGSANAIITVRGLTRDIRLKHETLRTQAAKLAGAREIAIGDAAFDAEFFLGGDAVPTRAAFDDATRAKALSVFGRRPSLSEEVLSGEDAGLLGIEDGALVVRFVDAGFPHPPVTPSELLEGALALAERMTGDDAEERLATIAGADPLPDVRLAALSTLRDERTLHPATRQALLAACEDADARVRLAAASALGAAGRDTLMLLATRATNPDGVSATAVTELGSALPADQARSILADALRARRLATAAACLDTLSHSGAHADMVAKVLSLESGALAFAAARALGRCGSPAHVPLLRDVESRHPKGDELARVCRSAIAAIHTRHGGAEPGQLSLAADQTGQVSLAHDEAGRVSLSHEKGTTS
jgi:hypothetical protein